MSEKYQVVKTYGNERGYSCCFRQHLADTHCHWLHGYSLGFELTFECGPEDLTKEGWVIDFGSLDRLEDFLKDTFDHTLLVAEDDPYLTEITSLYECGVINYRILPEVGCEAFAKLVYVHARNISLHSIKSVRCFEHGSNSAIYIGDN